MVIVSLIVNIAFDYVRSVSLFSDFFIICYFFSCLCGCFKFLHICLVDFTRGNIDLFCLLQRIYKKNLSVCLFKN